MSTTLSQVLRLLRQKILQQRIQRYFTISVGTAKTFFTSLVSKFAPPQKQKDLDFGWITLVAKRLP